MSDHFYTTDEFERERALAGGAYHDEGIACFVYPTQLSPPGTVPFFRLYNPDTGDHFYTTDANERDRAIARFGYRSEGIACSVFAASSQPGLTPLYRLWNGDAHDHFYTIDSAERDRAQTLSRYRDEPIACYVFPVPGPTQSAPAGSVPLYRLYVPDKSFWDKVGDFFSSIGNFVVGVLSTIGGAILDGLDGGLGWLLSGLSFILENTILRIPWLGGALRELWHIILTGVWGILSIIDILAGLLGFRPEKRMRIMIVVQEDEEGQPVPPRPEDGEILRLLQLAIDTFKGQANVRLIPVGAFRFSSPFQDVPTASEDYIYREGNPSQTETLDVNCDFELFQDVFGTVGSEFQRKLSVDLYFSGWRRLVGYGAPVAAFSVRSFKNAQKAGCAPPILDDWVIVKFASDTPGRVLAHEFGHACSLWHPLGTPDPTNLMTPGSDGGVGFELGLWQKVLLRASRHVTYF